MSYQNSSLQDLLTETITITADPTIQSGVYDTSYIYNSAQNSMVTNTVITNNTGGPYGWYGDNTTFGSNLSSTLDVKGDVEIAGALKLQGRDIGFILDKISERLGILQTNSELESRWERLRELREEYLKVEAEIKEKEEIFRALKT
jgi:hypothetical protein